MFLWRGVYIRVWRGDMASCVNLKEGYGTG